MPSLSHPQLRPLHISTLSLLVLLGCQSAGTSTGNPSPGDDGGLPGDRDADTDEGTLTDGESGGYCKAGESTDLAVDEESALGFSAADILAFAAGTHEETIRWNEQMNATLEPETGEGTVTITVTHDDGDVRYVLPDTTSNGGEEILIDIEGPGCTPWLEIDVHVTVETAGGALDESFDATLRTHNLLMATLFTHPDPDALGGDFMVTDTTPEGFALTQLDLNITFSQVGVNGTFGGVLTLEMAGGVTAGAGGNFADFGDASCGSGSISVGLEDEITGVTLQDALDAFAAHADAEIEWEDGTTITNTTLSFVPSSEAGCARLEDWGGDTTLVLNGELSMRSEDGRLDGTWAGSLEAHVLGEGQLGETIFAIDGSGLPATTEPGAAAAYGFPMEDVSSFDSAGIGVSVQVDSAGVVSGVVSLTGYTLAECAGGDPDDPAADPEPDVDPMGGSAGGASGEGMSTPGCRGSDPTPLAAGEIH